MSKQETAAQLRKVANFLKGLVQAADDIEAIGSMEGATAEAKAALAVAERDRDSALAELADAKAKSKALVKESKEVSNKLLDDAERDAKAMMASMLANAEKKANDIITKAEMQSGDMSAKIHASVMAAEQAVADLAVKNAALTAEVSDLEAKRALAQAEFDKLTKALDKIKAQFKIGD